MGKRITVELNGESIQNAIDEIEQYKESLIWKCTVFVTELQKIGIEIARSQSGEYGGYIVFEKTDAEQTGAGARCAISARDAQKIIRRWRYKGGWKEAEISPLLMAEFGSGHLAEVLDPVPGVGQGTFPGQKHAFDPEGWSYTNETGYHRSVGEAPSHPMHNAVIEMKYEIIKVARRVFGNGQ